MAANGNVCRCPAAYLLAGSESERAHARETGTRASEAEQIICYPHPYDPQVSRHPETAGSTDCLMGEGVPDGI